MLISTCPERLDVLTKIFMPVIHQVMAGIAINNEQLRLAPVNICLEIILHLVQVNRVISHGHYLTLLHHRRKDTDGPASRQQERNHIITDMDTFFTLHGIINLAPQILPFTRIPVDRNIRIQDLGMPGQGIFIKSFQERYHPVPVVDIRQLRH